jgi:hypothetical protein
LPRTKDHTVIREWVESRGGAPARVRGTNDLLRVSFGRSEKNLEVISWDEFFEAFDRNDLIFVYHESADNTRFARFARR